MIVSIIKVDEITYNKVFESVFMREVDSEYMTNILCKGRRGMNKKEALYDKATGLLVCRMLDLQFVQGHDRVTTDHWKDIALQIDYSATEEIDVRVIYQRPYATECNKYMKKLLNRYYSDEEVEDCLNKCSLDELTNETKQKHTNMPWYYETDTLYHFTNAYYYDINNAHLDALCEIFPLAKKALVGIRTMINQYKDEAKKTDNKVLRQELLNKAHRLKDIVNFYVGDLCNRNHRATNNWIVARTRAKIDSMIAEVNGELLYSNTDGFIVNCPKNTVETSNKLGDFKSEMSSTELWYYYNTKQTRWQLYQYETLKGTEKKGTAQLIVRQMIDLKNKKLATYDLDCSAGNRKAINIKEFAYGKETEEISN